MILESIVKDEDFKHAYKKGLSVVGAFVVLYAAPNKLQEKRFGITVSKKVGKAVQRNRVRRLIREVIRLNIDKFPNGYDYVIVSRVKAKSSCYEEIEKNIFYILKNLKKVYN